MTSLDSEYEALRNGSGFRVARKSLIVRFSGDDRLAFLHGMCSNDVQKLKPGSVLEALILTEHAHVIAGFVAFARETDLLIEIDRETWPRARAHLEKFLVADDVEIEELDDLGVVEVLGPRAAVAAAAIAGAAVRDLAPWRLVAAAERFVARFPRYGCEAFTVIAHAAEVDSLAALISHASPDTIAVSRPTIEVVRIENGVAQIGTDTNEKTIALEARLEAAISYSKGCYIGQETIERATARGGLKKKLFGLRIDAPQPPPADSAVMLEGKEVGRVSSAVASPRFGTIALANLHHSAWVPSTIVTIRSDSSTLPARVSDLPFV
jgi:folate-binding protein YgfZ